MGRIYGRLQSISFQLRSWNRCECYSFILFSSYLLANFLHRPPTPYNYLNILLATKSVDLIQSEHQDFFFSFNNSVSLLPLFHFQINIYSLIVIYLVKICLDGVFLAVEGVYMIHFEKPGKHFSQQYTCQDYGSYSDI